MSKSIFFKEEDIVENHIYNTAVRVDALLDKVKELCSYEQEYTLAKVVDLELAENILLTIRNLTK